MEVVVEIIELMGKVVIFVEQEIVSLLEEVKEVVVMLVVLEDQVALPTGQEVVIDVVKEQVQKVDMVEVLVV